MRKLASIQKVLELQPIEGKDRIELATVLGWHVIVRKGEFKVGDLCVYVEIDSLMPERPEFEFLRAKKFRIKTMKMAGVVSSGIVFPLDVLPEGVRIEEGKDVTEALGIKKYEPEEDAFIREPKEEHVENFFLRAMLKFPPTRHLACSIIARGTRKKMKAEAFPSFISKTDETRIQNMPFVLSGNDIFECREKLDGSSMTVFAIKKQVGFFRKREEIEIGVCSRNRRLIRGTKNSEKFFKAFDKYNMEEAMYELVRFYDWVAIQGELIGPGIQKNKYNLEDVDFYAFNYIRSTGQLPSVVGESTMWSYGIKWVPYVGTIEMPCSVDDVLKFATAPSIVHPDTLREGIVCRNSGKNISFKAVSPDFLLQYDL